MNLQDPVDFNTDLSEMYVEQNGYLNQCTNLGSLWSMVDEESSSYHHFGFLLLHFREKRFKTFECIESKRKCLDVYAAHVASLSL